MSTPNQHWMVKPLKFDGELKGYQIERIWNNLCQRQPKVFWLSGGNWEEAEQEARQMADELNRKDHHVMV